MATTGNTTADEPDNAAEAENLSARLRGVLARLSNQQKIMLMVAIAAIIALLVSSSSWLKSSDYRILFSNISERDGGAIISVLEQLNVPYRFNDSGGAILVPGSKVHEVRLRLASQGLPKGGAVGFELMENQKFGISQFAEQVNYQRGLEGELARTIQSISAVQTARVHLAIPKPTVFMREDQKPSASVLLYLHPGRSLELAQVAGIQNLVAASVPQLMPGGVTLLDQSGAMLSQLKSKLTEAGLDPTQIKYIQEIEASVIKRIEDILSPIVGAGNSKVQVAADIDFSQNEQTAETHRPNTTPPDISIRSQQTTETASATPSAQGVPGALTNQPPVPATAPLTQPAVAGAGPTAAPGPPVPGQLNAAGVQAAIASLGQPISTSKNATTNYEVDKTIRHTTQSVGTIKRLSTAVVVNYRKDSVKGGTKPLADTEIKQINDLVKEAMGFSKERGDTLSVANAPFTVTDKIDLEVPPWKDPEMVSLGKDLFKYLAIAAIVAYLLLGVVRPMLKIMFGTEPEEDEDALPPGSHLDVVAGEESEEEAAASAAEAKRTEASSLEKLIEAAREIAQHDPKVIANIIMEWTGASGN